MDKNMEAVIQQDERLDDFAISAFAAMGYDGIIPENIVVAYCAIKERKDRLLPGRISPEGLAMAAVLGEMADGNIPFVYKDRAVDEG